MAQRYIGGVQVARGQNVNLARRAAIGAVPAEDHVVDHVVAVAGGVDIHVASVPALQRVVAETAGQRVIAAGSIGPPVGCSLQSVRTGGSGVPAVGGNGW